MLILLVGLNACQKEFLDTKPNKALLVPQTLADLRALLDNSLVFNRSPNITMIADGDFFTTDAGLKTFFQDQERNSYTWQADIYGSESAFEWSVAYQQVFYANVVLNSLIKIPPGSDEAERRAVEGTALFHRAWVYYGLSQLYCPPYRLLTASQDLGVPVRLDADVTRIEPRGTLEKTYQQMVQDLLRARQLLPASTVYNTRPAVPAALALLARVYMAQGDYDRAGRYADTALRLSPALLDYNTLTASAARPFPKAVPNGNAEILFYSASLTWTFSSSSAIAYVDSLLYRSYPANDLRKTVFFKDGGAGKVNFKGSYTGVISLFSGIAADELYLMRAECRARAGDASGALSDLNALLLRRWKTGTFVPLTAGSADAALSLVLTERRKELVGRNMRWADLRRLNTDPRFAVTLVRTVDGVTYTLEPGSKRYTYPLSADEVQLGGLAQNER